MLKTYSQEDLKSALEDKAIAFAQRGHHKAMLLALKHGANFESNQNKSVMEALLQSTVSTNTIQAAFKYAPSNPQNIYYLFRHISEVKARTEDANYHEALLTLIPDFLNALTPSTNGLSTKFKSLFSASSDEKITSSDTLNLDCKLWSVVSCNDRNGNNTVDHSLVDILKAHNVEITSFDHDGLPVLFHATSEAQFSTLLSLGADISQCTQDGKTLLFPHPKLRYFDIQRNYSYASDIVDINAQDHQGNTALISAVQFGQRSDIDFLLSKGASVEIQNKNGLTARDYLSTTLIEEFRESGIEKLEKLLDRYIQLGGDIQSPLSNGHSLMFLAQQRYDQTRDISAAKQLIAKGFDIKQSNESETLNEQFIKACLSNKVSVELVQDDDEYFFNVLNINSPLNEGNLKAALDYLEHLFTEDKDRLLNEVINKDANGTYLQFGVHKKAIFDKHMSLWEILPKALKYPALEAKLLTFIGIVEAIEKEQNREFWSCDEECFLLHFYNALAFHDIQYVPALAAYLVRVDDHCSLDNVVDDVVDKYGYCEEILDLLCTLASVASTQHGLEMFEQYCEDEIRSGITDSDATISAFIKRFNSMPARYQTESCSSLEEVLNILFEYDENDVGKWLGAIEA